MTDLVVVSLEPWDEVWRRNQYLVDGLLREDPRLRVLFVEPAVDPLHDLVSGRKPSLGHPTRRRTDVAGGRLWTHRAVKWLPRRWQRSADTRLARGVVRHARTLGMTRPLLWINDPGMAELAAMTGWPTVYDITDDWLAANRAEVERDRLAAGERALLATAREVVACSPELVRRKSAQRRGGPIALIPNAVDLESYRRPSPRPADLPAGRTAVYVGTLHADRFDVDLCVRTAESLRGQALVVLVGPMLLRADAAAALRDAGVILLGARSRHAVVGYLQHADVLLVPHLVDSFTDSLDPIKLYEYLAVHKRIVSTPVAGFRDADPASVTIASEEGFAEATRLALNRAGGGASMSATTAPDWRDRVQDFRAVLARLAV